MADIPAASSSTPLADQFLREMETAQATSPFEAIRQPAAPVQFLASGEVAPPIAEQPPSTPLADRFLAESGVLPDPEPQGEPSVGDKLAATAKHGLYGTVPGLIHQLGATPPAPADTKLTVKTALGETLRLMAAKSPISKVGRALDVPTTPPELPEGLGYRTLSDLISIGADPTTYLSFGLGGAAGRMAAKPLVKRAAAKYGEKALPTKALARGAKMAGGLPALTAARNPFEQALATGEFSPVEYGKELAKSAVVGAAAGGAGAVPRVGLGLEIGAFAGVGAGLEGRWPTPEDFAHSAGVILGLKSVGAATRVGKAMWKRATDRKLTAAEKKALNGLTPEQRQKINLEALKRSQAAEIPRATAKAEVVTRKPVKVAEPTEIFAKKRFQAARQSIRSLYKSAASKQSIENRAPEEFLDRRIVDLSDAELERYVDFLTGDFRIGSPGIERDAEFIDDVVAAEMGRREAAPKKPGPPATPEAATTLQERRKAFAERELVLKPTARTLAKRAAEEKALNRLTPEQQETITQDALKRVRFELQLAPGRRQVVTLKRDLPAKTIERLGDLLMEQRQPGTEIRREQIRFNPKTRELSIPNELGGAFAVREALDRAISELVAKEAAKPQESTPKAATAEAPKPAFAEVLAAPRAPIAEGRIPVSPILGAEARPLRKIISDFARSVYIKVRPGKMPAKRAGEYHPASMRTVVRQAGDLDRAAHEIAHAADDRFGLLAEWAKGDKPSPYDAELIPRFSRHAGLAEDANLALQRAEGVAEWTRAYIVNPDAARADAPGFTSHFERSVGPEFLDALHTFSRQVREWSGASPVERTLANVETGPPEGRAAALLRRPQPPEDVFDTGWTMNLERSVLDELAPLWEGLEFAKRVRGIEELLPGKDPKILVRNAAGFNRKFEDVLESGPLDAQDQRVPGMGGISWLFEPLDTSSPKTLKADKRLAIAYMVNTRVLEKAGQLDAAAEVIGSYPERVTELRRELSVTPEKEGKRKLRAELREAARDLLRARRSIEYKGSFAKVGEFVEERKTRLVGTGGGIYSDTAQAREALNELAGIDPQRRVGIEEAARRYRMWSDTVLKYAADKGRITQESLAQIRERNEQYVSLQRLMEEIEPGTTGGRSRTLSSVSPVIRRFRGSTRPIRDPYLSLLENTERIMREADRNAALRSFRDVLTTERGLYEGLPVNLDSVGSRARPGDRNTIRIFVDGQPEEWQFHGDIHRALKKWGETEPSNIVYGLLQALPRLAHTAITHSPSFLVRNVIRDPMYRAVVSRTGSKPWGHLFAPTPAGIAEFNKDLSAFYRHGGGMFGYYGPSKTRYYQALKDGMNKAVGRSDTVVATPRNLLRGYGNLASMSETVGRVAEYRKAFEHARKKLGYDEHDAGLYAAYEARELTDFAVAGSAIRQINKYVIFTNAAVRGLARTVRAAREKPLRFAARWMTYIGTTELATYLWNWASGADEELRQQPAYLRDMFWNYKIGSDLWLRIPKPWELGVLASGLSRGIDKARGVDHAFEGWGESLGNALTPLDEQALLGPLVHMGEALMNYDLFRDRNIVPPWENQLDLELRRGINRSSRVGQLIQDAVGVDARKIDFLIEGQLGGLGRMATRASDIGREDREGLSALAMETSGLLRPSASYSARDVQWVMDYAARKGMSQHKAVQLLRKMLVRYYDLESAEAREEMGARIRTYASGLRERLPQLSVMPVAKRKAKISAERRREQQQRERAAESARQERNPFEAKEGRLQPIGANP